VVLTTHYLEEAQAMCKRVAMLKLGKVVALDSMASLIRRISGSQLIVNLNARRSPATCAAGHASGSLGARQEVQPAHQ
jgi:ABC-2 type transport system ATP-binding protein